MKEKSCAICMAKIEREDAPVIGIGGYGVPRYLCDSCAADIDAATEGRDYKEIDEAMDRISAKLVEANVEDRFLLTTLTGLLSAATERAEKIKAGTYDFESEDTEDIKAEISDEFSPDLIDEIPEELLESEEDRLKDEADEETERKINKVLDWVWLAVLVGTVAFMVWWIFFR